MENIKTTFAFNNLKANTSEYSETINSNAGSINYIFECDKLKYVNGQLKGITLVTLSVDVGEASWVKVQSNTLDNSQSKVKVTLNYSENLGPERTAKVIFTQAETNNKIILNITQKSGVLTYTFYSDSYDIEIPYKQHLALSLPPIYSYKEDSDKNATYVDVNLPRVMPEEISNINILQGSTPTIPAKVTFDVSQYINITPRIFTLDLLQAESGKVITYTITQLGAPTSGFALTTDLMLPLYFFEPTQSPQPGTTSKHYFSTQAGKEHILQIPLEVNTSIPGTTSYANSGDLVNVYIFSLDGSLDPYLFGQFIVPQPGETVKLMPGSGGAN